MALEAVGTQGSHESVDIQRDEQYWFPRGDIVLIANKQVAYKISVALLCWKATVFGDLIGRDVPQPPEQEMMDDCPVIHLTDEPEDLKILLNLVYDGWRFRRDDNHMKWPVVKVMILLGRKYDISELYDEGIEIFNRTFPRSEIMEFEERKSIQFSEEDIISAANVTETLDPDLHALALFLCCSLPIRSLTASLLGEGGGLSATALRKCLIGRETITDELVRKFQESSLGLHCRDGISTVWEIITNPRIAVNELLDRTLNWRTLLGHGNMGLCHTCRRKFNQSLLETRQEFRDGLKARFGLEESPEAAADDD